MPTASSRRSATPRRRDAATGALLQAAVGANAWRDFLAVGYEADGRQSVRPIEDMATVETE
jgi:hypothetical protein